MKADEFLTELQAHATSFATAVATNEGDWVIKGFIDIYKRIYTISVDTKIISKVLELLLFPMFVEFGERYGLGLELCPHQNFYPDLTFVDEASDVRFAVSAARALDNVDAVNIVCGPSKRRRGSAAGTPKIDRIFDRHPLFLLSF